MNKKNLLDVLLRITKDKLDKALKASQDAADYATNEETRADSKWDTQGVEASYLAAGQAAQVAELSDAFSALQGMLSELKTCEIIELGALIKSEVNGYKDWYYLLPVLGGEIVNVDNIEVTVITIQSPIGRLMLRKHMGQHFLMPSGVRATILDVQ